MAIECDPASLAEAAKCFNQGYGPLVLAAFRIRLLCAFLNGETMTCTPAALAELTACFLNMDAGTLDAIQTYLVCQVANSGGGGGGGTIQVFQDHTGSPPTDPTKPALSFPTGGGMLSQWDVGSQTWV